MEVDSLHSERVWAFDIGTGSFGIAVREGLAFHYVDSLLIPDGFASIDAARTRRRMARTRDAHQAREQWLRDCFSRVGLQEAVLNGRRTERIGGKWQTTPGDYRLEREFPPRNARRTRDGAPSDEVGRETCYCGAILRIRLLQGQPLAPWQIFKALHSAIQKRGYDPNVPWKAQERGKSKDPDSETRETLGRANELQRKVDALPEGCRLPCFAEAQLMGLWTPGAPGHTSIRQDHQAETARNLIFLRGTVESEVKALIAAAVRQLPQLAAVAADLLYGPAQAPYASYRNPAAARRFEERTGKRLVRGKGTDWMGLLAQKVPTFDNRAVENCALIPRFHAAKCEPRNLPDGSLDPDSLLPAEVTFLMKLKNLRFALAGGAQTGFTAEQIRSIFEDRQQEVAATRNAGALKLSKRELDRIVRRCGGLALLPNQTEIDPPRLSGRSRFCKPALRQVKRLVLSGKSPAEIHAELLAELNGNTNPLKGGVKDDLNWLLRVRSSGGQEATWANFYLPDESLSFLENAGETAEDQIRALIGRQNNPVVRHRLEMFWKLLRQLTGEFGVPDHVAIEFVREDFMGEDAKSKLLQFQRERRKARAEARKEAGAGRDALRYQLAKDQGEQCLYCGSSIGLSTLPNMHLDHIVPDKMGGPGAYWNFVVCCAPCNSAKKKRTPWQWFHEDNRPGWDAYVGRVESQKVQLRRKKVRLLTEADAPDLVQRYQTLAETAWIARLAQTLACLHFGWPRNFAGGSRRVVVLPGGLTARVRRKYGLNSLLGTGIAELESKLDGDGDAKIEEEIDKKCRADKRHHALDAMVLSFLPQWTSDPTKHVRVTLPEGIHRGRFRAELDHVEPRNLSFKRPVLRETIYGRRMMDGGPVAASRFEIRKLGFSTETPDGKLKNFCPNRLRKQAADIIDHRISAQLIRFADTNPTEDEWRAYAASLRAFPGGPLVRKAMRLSNKPSLSNYKDLSKDGTGAWRTSKEGHRGQWVYANHSGRAVVVPVMVFESKTSVFKRIRNDPDYCELVGYFESSCCISIASDSEHSSRRIPAGRYTLNTIQGDGRVTFTSAVGVKYDDVPLGKLLRAGFSRIL